MDHEDPELEALAARLLKRIPAVILELHRHTNFPLLLTRRELPDGEVAVEWTNTALAILYVASEGTAAPDELEARAVARILWLQEHLLGLPDSGAPNPNLASGCLETLGLIRAWSRFRTSVAEEAHRHYLPAQAQRAIAKLDAAIRDEKLAHADMLVKQAALLVAAGLSGDARQRAAVALHWPSLDGLVASLVSERAERAADAAWDWLTDRAPRPRWALVPKRPPARVMTPRIRVMSPMRAEGITATDTVNSKGFAMTLEELLACCEHLKDSPMISFDHDLSRPPGIIVLNTHLACNAGRHEVHVTVAPLTKEGEERLERGGGFSPAFSREGSTDE